MAAGAHQLLRLLPRLRAADGAGRRRSPARGLRRRAARESRSDGSRVGASGPARVDELARRRAHRGPIYEGGTADVVESTPRSPAAAVDRGGTAWSARARLARRWVGGVTRSTREREQLSEARGRRPLRRLRCRGAVACDVGPELEGQSPRRVLTRPLVPVPRGRRPVVVLGRDGEPVREPTVPARHRGSSSTTSTATTRAPVAHGARRSSRDLAPRHPRLHLASHPEGNRWTFVQSMPRQRAATR